MIMFIQHLTLLLDVCQNDACHAVECVARIAMTVFSVGGAIGTAIHIVGNISGISSTAVQFFRDTCFAIIDVSHIAVTGPILFMAVITTFEFLGSSRAEAAK
jgi:hypothetical protein